MLENENSSCMLSLNTNENEQIKKPFLGIIFF